MARDAYECGQVEEGRSGAGLAGDMGHLNHGRVGTRKMMAVILPKKEQ